MYLYAYLCALLYYHIEIIVNAFTTQKSQKLVEGENVLVEELKELSLQEQVLILMNRRNMTYNMLIPIINANLPNNMTPVKTKSEISRALSHGYSKGNLGKKNNAIIDGVKSALGI